MLKERGAVVFGVSGMFDQRLQQAAILFILTTAAAIRGQSESGVLVRADEGLRHTTADMNSDGIMVVGRLARTGVVEKTSDPSFGDEFAAAAGGFPDFG